MKNCLVTKLKEVVDNNDLPTFNTIILDYHGGNYSDADSLLYLATNDQGSIAVTFAVDVKKGSAQGIVTPANTTTIIPASSYMSFYFNSTSSIQDVVRIEDIYNIKSLLASKGFVTDATQKSGLNSLKYCNIEQFGGYDSTLDIPCKRLHINTPNVTSSYSFVIPIEGIQQIDFSLVDNLLPFVSLPVSNSVRIFGARVNGDVKDLPNNIMLINGVTSFTTGDIMNFITKARNAGRTTGYILFRYDGTGSSWSSLYFDGVAFADNPNAVKFTINSISYVAIEWTAATAGFATSQPAGADSVVNRLNTVVNWTPFE